MTYQNNLFGRFLFYLGHAVTKPKVLFYYWKLRKNEHKTLERLEVEQVAAIAAHLVSASMNSEYYKEKADVFKGGVGKEFWTNFRRLPVVDKSLINLNKSEFFNNNLPIRSWKVDRTGGSTGSPFQYRVSNYCNDMAFAILYRGWSRAGYALGDRIAVLAGGSLVSKVKSRRARVVELILNMRKYSSYGISEPQFMDYFNDMKSWRPKYLRGYVSSIYEFAKFVQKNSLDINFSGIFVTAEMLGTAEREYIERVFKTKVFNNYGLNDGAVSAFECLNGSMHIDMERGYLEVVPEEGQAPGGYGRLVATGFLNDATFLIRYDTGDLGQISSDSCKCGSPFPVLREIVGRKTDVLTINEKVIGSPVLTVLMSNIPVNRYQFVQNGNSIDLIIDEGNDYVRESHENFISSSLYANLGEFPLNFVYDSKLFQQTLGGKHRVVVKAN